MKTEAESERLVARVEAPAGDLQAGSRLEFMVMPAGTHTCNFGQAVNKLARRTILVDAGAASALDEQLKAVNGARGGKQRAFFDFDHAEEGPAAAWPERFFWRDGNGGQKGSCAPGVYCAAELSQAGAEAIRGKNYRAFSPVFYATKETPGRVVAKDDAELCMGSLVNEPAFHDIEPLWAADKSKVQSPESKGQSAGTEKISAADSSAAATDKQQPAEPAQQKDRQMIDEKKTAVAAENAAAENAEALKAKDAQNASLREENEQLKARETERRKKDGAAAVERAVKRGAIPAQNEQLKGKWQKACEENPESIEMLDGIAGNEALAQTLTKEATATVTRLQAKEGPANIIKALGGLMSKSRKIVGFDARSQEMRGAVSREVSLLYGKEVRPNTDLLGMPMHAISEALTAAQASDTLGTLSGTLVIQRTLEFFRINYPMFKAIYTDFSDQPALLGQLVDTRIVSKPAVQTYDPTLGADGRPNGWKTASAATTTPVQTSIDEHVGVPVVFDANTLASTLRRLFDEQAPAMSYALASYFVAKIYALLTAANYNGYAAVSGAKVPVAYATYVKAVGDFARSAAVDLNAIFNPNEVPLHDRFLLLNPAYYAQMGKDASLVTFWAAQRNPEIITEGELPKMSKFVPIEAPDFPITNNRVGFAGQKNAVVAIARIPQDYSKVLPGASYGNVTQISDPETGLTVMLVEYVNHTGGYAEMRMETMIGAGLGDKRAGLVLTSQ